MSPSMPPTLWTPARLTAVFGAVAAGLAVLMLGFAALGISQEWFENMHSVARYGSELRAQARPLRALFGVDLLFLLAYTGFFVSYTGLRYRSDLRLWLRVTLGAVLLAACLDALENFHILAMLHSAEAGRDPSLGQISAQYVLSAAKFTAGYLAAIGLAITYPRERALGRMVALSTGFAFPIVGVLAHVTPEPMSSVFGFARVGLFVSGYALSALLFWPQRGGVTSPSP